MAHEAERCAVCQALLDDDDLFCPNCGAEAPLNDAASATGSRVATHNFECHSCGASMSYDASASALRCPFCGSTELDKQRDATVLAAEWVVPFATTQSAALAELSKFYGQGWFRPGDLAKAAQVVKLVPVYVPYWVFSARTHTYWTADTNQVPAGASAGWAPVTGEHRGEHAGILIGASRALETAETAALQPYDLSQAVAAHDFAFNNVTDERFSLPRKYARPLAQSAIESRDAEACKTRYLNGKCRNLKVNVLSEGLTGRPVLLPVWVMAYQYRKRTFRFLVNGQSGRAHGSAPVSTLKIGLLAGLIIAAIAALGLIAAMSH